jgi:hypothetical protein
VQRLRDVILKNYERNINTSVAKLADGTLLTSSSLLDLNHHMGISLVVRVEDQRIIDAYAFMNRAPFKICRETIDTVLNLKGLRVERGIMKKIEQAVGTSRGCSHLLELGKEAVVLTANVLIGLRIGQEEWVHRELSDEEFIETAIPYLRNTCRPFREKKPGKRG